MALTDKGRYDETIAYIHRYIGSELALLIERGRDPALGKGDYGGMISLKKAQYNKHGTDDHHHAVRALLLCQKIFLKSPWAVSNMGAAFDYSNAYNLDQTRQFYLKATEAQVKNNLIGYLPVKTASLKGLVQAATEIKAPAGRCEFEILTRHSDPFPAMQVCFDALKFWLFKAGFVSIPWLTKTGPTITAQTVSGILGDGVVIDERNIARMPAGYMFNIHRAGDKSVNHWGVCLGNGMAAACNTVAKAGDKVVRFTSGDGNYGHFPLADSVEVCKHKYALHGKETTTPVVVRQIDPRAVTTYF